MFQHKLTELREQFDVLERLATEDIRKSKTSLERALVDLQRTAGELGGIVSVLTTPRPDIGSGRGSTNGRHASADSTIRSDSTKQGSETRWETPFGPSDAVNPWSHEAIARSEARKAAILESSLDAVITIDHHGRAIEFNAAAETMFGRKREDVFQRDLVDVIVPARMRAHARRGFDRYRVSGDDGLVGRRFSTYGVRADGVEFPVEVALVPIRSGDPPVLTIYVLDATAQWNAAKEVRRYQARLRSLTADLLVSEEHERRLLAIDLHDGLSQTIALAQIKLSTLRNTIERPHAAALQEIQDLVEHANRAARSIGFELSPPILHDLGLEPALHWLVENLQARYGIVIELQDDGTPKPTDERTRVILFRSIRELLINAAKHAGAHTVHVRLERDNDQLNAAVEDDGVGMEPDVVDVKGFGLFSIHERLSHVGGSMRIDSAPGRGTRVHLRAPLAIQRTTKAMVEA